VLGGEELTERSVRGRDAARNRWGRFIGWFNGLELDESAILVVFAVAVGIVTALAVIVFFRMIEFAHTLLFSWPVDLIPDLGFPIYRPLFTAVAIALAAWISRRYAGGEDGPIVPYVQRAVVRRGGRIPTRPTMAHAAASAVTIGGGGSAGTEGPVAVVGATVGSFLGRAFGFTTDRVKVLIAAGAASGISASFNAPIAGAFFALEEVLGSLVTVAFPAVVVSSVVAAVVARTFLGNHTALLVTEQFTYASATELLVFFPLLGAIGGVVGVLFVRTERRMARLLPNLRIRPAMIPWLAGGLVGVIVLASDGLLGGQHSALQSVIFGRIGITTLLLLCMGKILATTLTLRGGGSGGVFTPSLFVGAALGGACGMGLGHLFPGMGIRPEAYALVGMGVMVAAATHAPITAIFIVPEMTNDYAITMPLMLAVVIAYLVARLLESDSLYTLWLKRRGESLDVPRDRTLLKVMYVRDVVRPARVVLREDAVVKDLLAQLGQSDHSEIPVVTAEDRLRGTIQIADIAQVALDRRDLADVLLAADLVVPTETVQLDDTLFDAMRRMGVRGTTLLPVIEAGTDRLLGVITRGQVLTVYEQALAETSTH
jgi:chloride channel protein, CIC family